MEWFLSSSLLLLSLILLIKQGLCEKSSGDKGIACYVCNSRDDPRCGNPFNHLSFKRIQCSDLNYMDEHSQALLKLENKTQPNFCRKNYQTVTLGGKTDTRIVRSCGYLPKKKTFGVEDDDDDTGEERCFRRAGTFEVMVTYCTCLQDGCNGANRFGSKNLFAVFPLVLGSLTHLLNLPRPFEFSQ